jgi:hypothetical protein
MKDLKDRKVENGRLVMGAYYNMHNTKTTTSAQKMEMIKNWYLNYVWLTFHVSAYIIFQFTLYKRNLKKKITAWLT